MLKQLEIVSEKISWDDLDNYKDIGKIKVIEKGKPLFPRVDNKEEVEYIKGLMKK